MAALPSHVPIPPFPRWTGMRATLGRPHYHGPTPAGVELAVVAHVPPITRRARLWMAWRVATATAEGVPDAAADR